MSAEGRFLTGSTMGHVVRMTLTGAAGITFVFLVDATNLFWVSLLGDPRLVAAIGFAFAIQFFSVSSGIGLMIAATVLVSRAIGARRRDDARRLAGSAVIIACIVQAAMAAAVIAFRYDILRLAGATGETLDLAARYLLFTVPSLPIMVIGMVASGALRAEGDGKRAMYVTLTAGGVSVFTDPLFIFVLGLGLDGAAMGLTVSRVVMMTTALIWATRVHDLIAMPSLRGIALDLRPYFAVALPAILTQMATPFGNYVLTAVLAPFGDDAVAGWAVVGRLTVVAFGGIFALDLRPYFAVALPAILTQMATPFGNYVLTAVLAPFGDDAVAGWAVVGRLTVVAFGGIFALSGAIGGIFGQNFGAGLYDRLVTTYRDAMIFCLGYTVLVWGLLVLTGDAVGRAFGLTPDGAQVLRAFTHVGAGAFLFTGGFFVSNAAFNALGRPTRATVLTWIRDGVLTWPVATWMAGLAGAVGVIYAQAALAVVIGVVSALWGWHFVRNLDPDRVTVEPGLRRGWLDPNTYRRR